MTHSPDSPFGCAETWGPAIAVWGSDGRLHICNKQHHDRDDHRCKCGATAKQEATP